MSDGKIKLKAKKKPLRTSKPEPPRAPGQPPAVEQWDGQIAPRSPHGAPRPCERRARRAMAEKLYLETSKSPHRIAQEVAPIFQVSPRTVRNDLKAIVRKWTKEDSDYLTHKRSLVVRRFEKLFELAVEADDQKQALSVNIQMAKILGLLDGDARSINITNVVNDTKDRDTRIELLRNRNVRNALKEAGERR